MIKGNVIKHQREKLNMTQDELAIACGYKDKSSICKLEKGQLIDIPLSKAILIAKVLKLELMDIVKG